MALGWSGWFGLGYVVEYSSHLYQENDLSTDRSQYISCKSPQPSFPCFMF
jgi:hypothetical protein